MTISPAACLLALVLLVPAAAARNAPQGLPPDYTDELLLGGWDDPIGVTFDPTGRLYVWERDGRVHLVDDGVRLPNPLINLRDEVGGWGDFGMLGFALDPDFHANGHFYLFHVVDRHHLLNFGTPAYDPTADQYDEATIGRITRYTADPATDYTTTIPGSRLVLLGESIDTGVPILHNSHGTGSLVFGDDGTLLASVGDGATYVGVDAGSNPITEWEQALADGIIRPEENVGAFRAQMIGSLNGKVLRLDPATGDGVSSNPFYDAAAPRSPRSRVWTVGLRNPYRMTLRRGTGHADPNVGDPGTLYVVDVGWYRYEDLQVVTDGGMNCGWPVFEGVEYNTDYGNEPTANLDAPNPLFGQGGCGEPYFQFHELLAQELLDHNPIFPNPCDPTQEIHPGTPTFMHHRPVLDYRHHGVEEVRLPVFQGNQAAFAFLGDPGAPVAGTPFAGNCGVAGLWHSGRGLDATHRGLFFALDFRDDWIRALRFDDEDRLLEILDVGPVPDPVAIAEDPADGSLVYASLLQDEVRRVRYTGDTNGAPVAVIEADSTHGTGPLQVRFDGSGSSDPEGGALTFLWQFGNGTSSTHPSPVHTFPSDGSPTSFLVRLTVTDPAGAEHTSPRWIAVDNTPPDVTITSFANGSLYSTVEDTTLPLEAAVSDLEHPIGDLEYAWQVSRHHAGHFSDTPLDTTPATSATLTPTPCNGEFFAYRVTLTVTDPGGLQGVAQAWLFPDCAGPATVALAPPATGSEALPNETIGLEAQTSSSVTRVEFFVDGERIGHDLTPPFTQDWTPALSGTYVVSAVATASDGASVSSQGLAIDVVVPTRAVSTIAQPADDAAELVGRVSRKEEQLALAYKNLPDALVGMRFVLDVPQGADVTSAYVQLVATEVGRLPATLTVRAEASDDAPPISQAGSDLSARGRTFAGAVWSPGPWLYPEARGIHQRTSDLREVLQEIVDRPGWQAGGAVLLLVDGTGTRVAESLEGSSAGAPRLVVEYGDAP
ncbi:MAG: PKD domain-containing protein [bacterium]|nr:PKD domain-containing protein [bacterium]